VAKANPVIVEGLGADEAPQLHGRELSCGLA
jgi:hypothetical protein